MSSVNDRLDPAVRLLVFQYWNELERYALSPEEGRKTGKLAKAGDTNAYLQVMYACFVFVFRRAGTIYRTSKSQLICEFFDLVQVGNLAVIEKLPVAIQEISGEGLVSYLCKTAEMVIRDYCNSRGGSLISIPNRRSNRSDIEVKSLDLLLIHEADEYEILEELNADEMDVDEMDVDEMDTDELESHINLYANLYAAVAKLSPRQREVVIRHYGLFDQPEERLRDLIRGNTLRKSVDAAHGIALQKLRQNLK